MKWCNPIELSTIPDEAFFGELGRRRNARRRTRSGGASAPWSRIIALARHASADSTIADAGNRR